MVDFSPSTCTALGCLSEAKSLYVVELATEMGFLITSSFMLCPPAPCSQPQLIILVLFLAGPILLSHHKNPITSYLRAPPQQLLNFMRVLFLNFACYRHRSEFRGHLLGFIPRINNWTMDTWVVMETETVF